MADLPDTYEGLIYAELHGEEVTATRRLTHSGAKRTESEYRRQSWSTGQIPRERPASRRTLPEWAIYATFAAFTESTASNLFDVSLESIQRDIENVRANYRQTFSGLNDYIDAHREILRQTVDRVVNDWAVQQDHLTLHPRQWADLLAATAASPAQQSDWRGPTDAATVDTSLLRASTAFPARSPSLRDHPGEAPHRVKRK